MPNSLLGLYSQFLTTSVRRDLYRKGLGLVWKKINSIIFESRIKFKNYIMITKYKTGKSLIN